MNNTAHLKTTAPMSYSIISRQFIAFLYAPAIAFFFFIALPALVVYAVNLLTEQRNIELPMISISIALLYLLITPPALCTGLVYSICTIYKKNLLPWTVTTLIYAVLGVLWCSTLTFNLTGHLPTLQVIFSNNSSISYEVIWSACLFILLFAVTSLGFFPIAILSHMMTIKAQHQIIQIILLALSIILLICGFVYKTRWLPAIQALF